MFGETADTTTFLGRVTNGGVNLSAIGSDDHKIRFTDTGGLAGRAFDDRAIIDVPVELCSVGRNTPDDSADDYLLVPFVC